ncbi:MAG: hypothetical protein EKE12_00940 [Candidatus Symbiopectobacterium sp. Clec_Harlan]|uniref:hypothetical protein n=1 Tax=Symbiopectobacterium sp. TaxID=2952789 RepID=UPI001A32F7AD|nr:hypothetical protein [Candidatus Symbiopectobacterium sp. Clec_Harlan]
MAKFRYNGDFPNWTSLRLADGRIQDVMFHPGQVVDVPVDHPFIVSLEEQGYLTFLGFDYPDAPPEPPKPLTDFEQRLQAAKHPTGKLARYRYDGQQMNGAALRLPDGSILDVMFWPGQEVTLPMDNDYVLVLEAQGYLTFLGNEAETGVAPIVAAPLTQAITSSGSTVALSTDETLPIEEPVSTSLAMTPRKRGKVPADTKSNEVTP